jgi:hypothetical protein
MYTAKPSTILFWNRFKKDIVQLFSGEIKEQKLIKLKEREEAATRQR